MYPQLLVALCRTESCSMKYLSGCDCFELHKPGNQQISKTVASGMSIATVNNCSRSRDGTSVLFRGSSPRYE